MRKAIIAFSALCLSTLTACGENNTAGTDAVAVGNSFQFHAPGGKTVIHYPESERAPINNISGPAVGDSTKTISLSDYDNGVVVLNAWGQWCGPCRTEVDDLQEVHEMLEKSGGSVIGINVRDTEALAEDFIVDNGLTYPSIYDPPFKLAAQLGGLPATAVPTTIVLDKQHRPAVVFLKQVTAAELMEAIKPLQ